MKLLGFLLALLVSQAYAADRCVSAIGTATTGSCASTCTSSDFATAATCYKDVATGGSSITTALTQSTSDGDTITFDDGTHTITGQITTTAMTANGATITLRCRTATQASCILSDTSATGTMFLGNDAVESNNFTFQNIGFTRTVTMTDTARPGVIQATSATGNIVLDGVKFGPITIDWTGAGSVVRGLVQMGQSNANKTLTFQNGVLVDTVSVSGDSIAAIANTDSTNNMVVTGTVAAPGLIVTNLTTVNANNGALYCEDACDVTGLSVNGWVGSESGGGSQNGFMFHEETTLVGTLTKARFKNITFTGVSPGAGAGYIAGPFVISDVQCDNMQMSASNTGSGLGACIYAISTSAVGTIDNYSVTNSRSNYGPCFYESTGASASISGMYCADNKLIQGAVYFGGTGSTAASSIQGSIITRNKTSDVVGDGVEGIAVMCQLRSDASAARTCNLDNVTIFNNTGAPTATASVLFKNNDTDGCAGSPCLQTANIRNSIIRNGYAQEIAVSDAGASDQALTINDSNLTASADPVSNSGAGSSTESLARLTQTVPGWIVGSSPINPNDFRLGASAAERCAGKELLLGQRATYNQYASFCPSIGAFGAGSGDAASARTAR